MLDTNKTEVDDETESGFVEVVAEGGYIMNIFVLSTKDLEKLKPTADSYRKLAVMMSDSKPEPAKHLSKRERIHQVLRR